MNVLVIGSGGREHALVWKLAQSPRVERVFFAPGNGGAWPKVETVPIAATDIAGLRDFALREGVGLTMVGPEQPLVEGIVDRFAEAGLRVFGPNAYAAQLEGSKIFAKELMSAHGVPTADYAVFDDADAALAWLRAQPDKPWVVKADGLAAGKGVLICDNRAEAEDAVKRTMIDREFGDAGNRLLIEDRLEGFEVSLLAICAGQACIPLAPAQDYKRVGEGDAGPNTGGMGAYSPMPTVTQELIDFTRAHVINPVLQAIDFTGVLYCGLMITAQGPKVLEFNVRFGDPETQVILPRLETDLLDLLEAAVDQRLDTVEAQWSPQAAVTVVCAAGGYPGNYAKGKVISGLDAAGALPGVTVFHAGTKAVDGKVVTNGGRVLNVTAVGDSFAQAIDRAYAAVDAISWDGKYARRDIAARVREAGR
jgi:phosphoribosylamine--glycine ligase